jgi:MSHA biogenesis protein MshQ
MALSFQATGAFDAGTGNVSPAWPAHQAGDIALLFIESRGEEPATLGTPAGFSPVLNSPQSTDTTTAGTRLTVYWARATSAAMAAPTVTDPGDHVVAQILTYRGVVETGNPWDVTVGGVQTTAATGIIVTGVTTTVPDTLVVVAVAHGIDGNSTARFSGWANTNLSSIVERVDLGRNNNDGGGFGIIDGVKATAGPTGNTTATLSNDFVKAFLTIALKPDTTPPTVTSIVRADLSPTSTLSVSWNVTFSEAVTGVNAADFSLVHGGGLSSGSIMSVTGSGTNWVVQASTGFGTGTLGLNLVDDDTILDASGNRLGGTGTGNGNFVGQIYEITRAPCPPPSNLPTGVTVTCQCDNFTAATGLPLKATRPPIFRASSPPVICA